MTVRDPAGFVGWHLQKLAQGDTLGGPFDPAAIAAALALLGFTTGQGQTSLAGQPTTTGQYAKLAVGASPLILQWGLIVASGDQGFTFPTPFQNKNQPVVLQPLSTFSANSLPSTSFCAHADQVNESTFVVRPFQQTWDGSKVTQSAVGYGVQFLFIAIGY